MRRVEGASVPNGSDTSAFQSQRNISQALYNTVLLMEASCLSHRDYTVGWICALALERAAAVALLDVVHRELPQPSLDDNIYTLGRIGDHNVAIACLPAGITGVTSAARVAEQMRHTFPSLRFNLMVGVGGGVPSADNDIRLGDVVVSSPSGTMGGVVQYDFGKTIQGGRFVRTGSLNRPPDILLSAVSSLHSNHMINRPAFPGFIETLGKKYPELAARVKDPGHENDILFEYNYDHPPSRPSCLSCSEDRIVPREPRPSRDPEVHYGLIASGNQVMRDGLLREKLREEMGMMCFEMEAAGLMDSFPCLVIRGVCDYADSHKNKRWQPYAAVMAAAYAKELILTVPRSQLQEDGLIPTTKSRFLQSSKSPMKTSSRTSSPGRKLFSSGMQILHETEYAEMDIVFIHGLCANREDTWTFENTFWPRDLLKNDLVLSRIMTFGYDIYSNGDSQRNPCVDIFGQANHFLQSLATVRDDSRSTNRPIIIIAHCIGGLIVKQALSLCSESPDEAMQVIEEHVVGVVFLATPHGKKWTTDWANLNASAIDASDEPNVSLLSLLATDLPALADLDQKFLSLLTRRTKEFRPIPTACFYETVPLSNANFKLVEAGSATIPNSNSIPLHADHENIGKFRDSEDLGYQSVVRVIRGWTTDGPGPEADADEFLGSLSFSGMGVRQAVIEDADNGTCNWLADHPHFKSWINREHLEESHGLLWIKGKPGSGKS